MTRADIFAEIEAERARQDAKWGEQNHPSVPQPVFSHVEFDRREDAELARAACDRAAREGRCTWMHIAREEFAEAIAETDAAAQRAELVQLAAVVVAWIECLDRRAP